MPVELELKFEISGETYNKALQFFDKEICIEYFCFNRPVNKYIIDTYFDTSDLAIAKRNSSLRVRTIDNAETLMTFKTSYSGDNESETISQRYELENYISNDFLNEIHKTLRDKLQVYTKEYTDMNTHNVNLVLQNWGLQQIFCIENHRQIIEVMKNDTIVAEIALDSVHFNLQPAHEREFEMEIEEKNSNKHVLYNIKHIIEKQINICLQHSSQSKYKRGLQLKIGN